MSYFRAKKKSYISAKIIVSVVAFIVIILISVYGADSMSQQNLSMQKSSLEKALHNGTIEYYALNGYYPDSLNELLGSCVVSYDSDKFYVDYQPVGSNIMPEITIIERK